MALLKPLLGIFTGAVGAKGKIVLVLVASLGLAAAAGLGAWKTASIVDGWISAAASAAEKAERLKWQVAIEKSNREVAEAQAQRATAVAALEAGAGAEIATLRQQLTALETANATLPGADRCGIDRDRVRLLR